LEILESAEKCSAYSKRQAASASLFSDTLNDIGFDSIAPRT